jgi:hypothetical protein
MRKSGLTVAVLSITTAKAAACDNTRLFALLFWRRCTFLKKITKRLSAVFTKGWWTLQKTRVLQDELGRQDAAERASPARFHPLFAAARAAASPPGVGFQAA